MGLTARKEGLKMKFLNSLKFSLVILVFTLTISAQAAEPGLEWATYYGEGNMEVTEALAVAPDGSVVATGFIMIFDPFNIDTFVAQYSPDGKDLLNFLILDGGDIDGGFGVAVDESGTVTVVGQTWSPEFPVTEDALQDTFGGFADGFLVQLDPDFEIIYSTFLGGSGEETIADMMADGHGGFVVCGYTGSSDLPVTDGAFQTEFGGGVLDAFVARIVPGSDEPLSYCTYLGGSGDDSDFDPDDPYGYSMDERLLRQAVVVMPQGNIVVAGMTWSEDFPVTPGAWQTEHSPMTETYYDNPDMYLTVLDPKSKSKQLVYSTLLGGTGRDISEGLVVRDAAKVILTGLSQSADFPVTKNAYQDELLAEQNAVLMQLLPLPHIPKKAQIEYSTYCGGTGRDAANGVYLMRSGDIVISGVTLSPDYPITDGSVLNGDSDLFLTRLDISRKPEKQLVFSTLFGGSSDEGLCVGPVGNGFGDVYIGGDTFSDDLPGTAGTYDEFHDGVSYDAFVARYYLGGLGD